MLTMFLGIPNRLSTRLTSKSEYFLDTYRADLTRVIYIASALQKNPRQAAMKQPSGDKRLSA